MRSRSPLSIAVACMIMLVGPTAALCQPPDPASRFPPSGDYQPAAGVGFRVVFIISEGVRLHGELFWPRAEDGHRLPTVVMAHGWGGVAAALRRDASDIAQAGYLVLLFDYRGWGESDARGADRPGAGGRRTLHRRSTTIAWLHRSVRASRGLVQRHRLARRRTDGRHEPARTAQLELFRWARGLRRQPRPKGESERQPGGRHRLAARGERGGDAARPRGA